MEVSMIQKVGISIILLGCLAIAGCSPVEKADLVIMGGKVVTVDSDFSIEEAVAVRDGSIVFVGRNKAVKPYIGNKTKVLTFKNKLILPGLIDAHAHMSGLGKKLTRFNTNSCTSFEEIVGKVADEVKKLKPGEWIIGGRWDHNRWQSKTYPVHDALSKVSPHNPVYLSRVDGNSAFVNARAMAIAGIEKRTLDPPGGVIVRTKNGMPTGVLINRAMNMVKKHFPRETSAQWKKELLAAVDACLKKGLTGWHEAGVGPQEIQWYKELIDQDQLRMRVYAMLGEQEVPVLKVDLEPYFRKNRVENYGRHFLSVRSIKLFFDGALGSRGAAFFKSYEDDAENRGLLRIDPDYIYRVTRAALKAGMGVNTHCIGIRGNRLCLEAYGKALSEVPVRDHRLRIEHAQVVEPKDVDTFRKLAVIPSMQPTHCTSDMLFIRERVGQDRCKGAYAWRWFIDAGLRIPCGSDFPVESHDPLTGIYAAVTRQDHSGNPTNGWHAEQCMTRREAIKGYTIWAAHAGFQEKLLGSIEIGKLADFTVLDRDILAVEAKEILNTRVVCTIVAGKIRYLN
jgi:predicted amidohydrolase YtcJ